MPIVAKCSSGNLLSENQVSRQVLPTQLSPIKTSFIILSNWAREVEFDCKGWLSGADYSVYCIFKNFNCYSILIKQRSPGSASSKASALSHAQKLRRTQYRALALHKRLPWCKLCSFRANSGVKLGRSQFSCTPE